MGRLKVAKTRVRKGNKNHLDEDTYFPIMGMYIPSFRTKMCQQRGTLNNFLFATWGGLGDVVCAVPVIQWALENYKHVDISLASHHLSLFKHLKFKETWDLTNKKNFPTWQKYFVIKTICEEKNLVWEFMNHMLCNSVDYISLNMFRKQLPIESRVIRLQPDEPNIKLTPAEWESFGIDGLPRDPWCLVHPGRHWPVKTFPKDWWDSVLRGLIERGVTPVLIGADSIIPTSKLKDGSFETVGTVDVDASHCIDLRNRTSLNDLVYLCQKTKVLLSNDSSPIHIAASGNAHIGFVATVKHADYLMHWRDVGLCDSFERPVYGWRMKNFGKGGVWDIATDCPNNTVVVSVDTVEDRVLRSWLPDPEEFASWGADRAKSCS